VAPLEKADIDRGAGAQYDPAGVVGAPSGTLSLPPILGRIEEGYILHESAHAFFDLKKIKLKATDEEAIGYIVVVLYFRMTGLTIYRWAGGEPFISAKAVADGLLKQYAAGVAGVPAVDPDAWDTLRLNIALHPHYIDKEAGFPRWFFGEDSYPNDG
jgi:hypothetical protein